MTSIVVRTATLADADAIGRIHVRAWQQTYAHVLPAEFLTTLDAASRIARWRDIIRSGDTRVLLAEADGVGVGWATAGPARDDDAPRPLELEGLYVLQEHHGTGAGQALLDAAIGDAGAYLWVAEDNPRAEAFYRRNRFARDGATARPLIGETPVETVRLIR